MTAIKRVELGVYGAVIAFFVAAGMITSLLRHNGWYALLFAVVGSMAVVSVALERAGSSPRTRRAIRIATMWCFAGLFGWLMTAKAVNFQMPQVVFDLGAATVSGALIQLIISRLLAPFLFGNAFCSRACWNGAVFELVRRPARKAGGIWQVLRYLYLALTLAVPVLLMHAGFSTTGSEQTRRLWVLAENGLIFAFAAFTLPWWGSRAYCRLLCPALTISRWLAPWSRLKVSGRAELCTSCMLCEQQCPMTVPIVSFVTADRRVAARDCILCGRCVEECPTEALSLGFR